jgi:hypothetical protein
MSGSPSKCLKCGQAMDQGFLVDHARNQIRVSEWAPGAPRKSFWSGTKITDPIPVATFRCTSCGYLESYARPEFVATKK